jgi:triosephosphate isomerase (TIM)
VRKIHIVANWKMNPSSFVEAKRLFEASKKALEGTTQVRLTIAPPALYIRELRKGYRGARIDFSAQDCHFEKGGAHTGLVSAAQVLDAGVRTSIVGHAERREAGESDEVVKKKVAALFALGMLPILCVGEDKRDESGGHFEMIARQLRAAVGGLSPKDALKIIIAYEPRWAIGTSVMMQPSAMHEMSIFIRKFFVERWGEAGRSVSILYGGSVHDEGVAAMLREAEIDGLLVGRASLEPGEFSLLVRAADHVQ